MTNTEAKAREFGKRFEGSERDREFAVGAFAHGYREGMEEAAKVDCKAAFALFYRCAERLGSGPTLLAVLGSYGDTMSDDDVFELLEKYASGAAIMDKVLCRLPEQVEKANP